MYNNIDFLNFCTTYLKLKKQKNLIKLIDIKPINMKNKDYLQFLTEFETWNKTANTKKFYYYEIGSQNETIKYGLKIKNNIYVYLNHVLR